MKEQDFLNGLDELESNLSMIKNIYYGVEKGNVILDVESMREEFEQEIKEIGEHLK